MVTIKSKTEIEKMRVAGKITGDALREIEKHIKPGVSTLELDRIAFDFIKKRGATPSFLHYNGFPGSICASPNSWVVHGIPSKNVVLKEGDIISIDMGAQKDGYHGDAARTYAVGKISDEAKRLIEVTKQSFFEGIKYATHGAKLGDVSYSIQEYVENNGFSVVRDLVGHGIGKNLHEDPNVPNFGHKGRGLRLAAGMTIAVEPMVNAGKYDVVVLDDDWTVETEDGSLSAHYENTVLITKGECEILTL
ncbi:MAG: type I methionyl aminopeptidase [Clostridia bacterium]|nr:type I methionyl aminopeptidase [Clostridia bacterium]